MLILVVVFSVFIRYDEWTRSIERKREECNIPFSFDISTKRINLVETVHSYIFPDTFSCLYHIIKFSLLMAEKSSVSVHTTLDSSLEEQMSGRKRNLLILFCRTRYKANILLSILPNQLSNWQSKIMV